jgi:hypothetical protein
MQYRDPVSFCHVIPIKKSSNGEMEKWRNGVRKKAVSLISISSFFYFPIFVLKDEWLL